MSTVIKRIIVLEEHHGIVYLDASTDVQLEKACLSILQCKWEDGWFKAIGWQDEPPPQPPLTQEQTDQLPEGKVKDFALEEWASYQERLKIYNDEKKEMKLVEKAIKNQDGKLAYRLLKKNPGWYCEDFYLEKVMESY